MIRESESIEDFTMLGYHTKDYVRYDIKKFFNLNILEYLNTTSFFKRTIKKQAIIRMTELKKEMDDIEKKNNKRHKEIAKNEKTK